MVSLTAGDEKAFNTIYRLYAASLIQYASSKLDSLEEARDIIHDFFVYLWEARADIVIHKSLKGFLFSAVRYRILDQFRKKTSRNKFTKAIQSLSGEAGRPVFEDVEAKELNERVLSAVNELTPKVRQVWSCRLGT